MNFFRKMGIVTTIIFCSHNIFGQTTTSAYYEYDAECLGVELDGSQTLRIWGVGRNKKDAVEQAKKNAVRTVLFKGIHGGLSGCNTKPVILEVNAEEKYEDYFNAFFMSLRSILCTCLFQRSMKFFSLLSSPAFLRLGIDLRAFFFLFFNDLSFNSSIRG